ncbi:MULTISPECIES: hypothetical protein [Cyanophyceae]|uniref:hypothetical protein n=1 Tax=Cyanophyceae TaxID=3028117 RepID=UPI0016870A0C|nr:hypothetical protein [Trichocoleus sp. FACHB-40]MBD2006451.1 hypothetical protein [Trichocoleus sp. FACHB-40]
MPDLPGERRVLDKRNWAILYLSEGTYCSRKESQNLAELQAKGILQQQRQSEAKIKALTGKAVPPTGEKAWRTGAGKSPFVGIPSGESFAFIRLFEK